MFRCAFASQLVLEISWPLFSKGSNLSEIRFGLSELLTAVKANRESQERVSFWLVHLNFQFIPT